MMDIPNPPPNPFANELPEPRILNDAVQKRILREVLDGIAGPEDESELGKKFRKAMIRDIELAEFLAKKHGIKNWTVDFKYDP